MRSTDAVLGRSPRRRLAGLALLLAVALALVPGVALAAPTAPAAAPGGDAPIWTLPQTGDLLAAFSRNDYDEQDGSPEQVPSPDRPGSQAVLFSLAGGAQRSEMQPRIPYQTEGNVQYYTYVARLGPDFPTDARTWQLILQWHQFADSGSPPIAIQIRDGRLVLAAEGEDRQDLGPIQSGAQIDLTMRIASSEDPDRGSVDVWRDGRRVLAGYRPPNGTLLDEGNYMKVGIYRDTSIDQAGRLWIDDLRVGPTLASVRSPDSASSTIPDSSDPGMGTAAGGPNHATAIWVATGVLVVVLALGVISLRQRFVRRRVRR